MAQWEHLTAIIRTSSGPITTINAFHSEQLGKTQQEGWEGVGVTTLADGALLFFFKRPATGAPVGIESGEGIEIGFVSRG